MPICQRLSGAIYPRLKLLVDSASEFIFFGTYSLSVDRSILSKIIRKKQENQNLLAACLLPPPTDFILWDFSIRNRILQAYGLTSLNQIEFARIMAVNPQPAYSVLDSLWTQRRPNSFQRGLLAHVEKIAELYQNQVIIFLEPNMHAKFVASESDIYEGSGNLTYFGLRVNVEVYNFYPRNAAHGRVYQYAISSYVNFLRNYLADFVNWKSGQHYLSNARQLGSQIEQIADQFDVRFNPKVTQEKIDAVTEAREQLLVLRSKLWQLPGHKLLLKLDFSLSRASFIAQNVVSKLWRLLGKKIEENNASEIMKDLETVNHAVKGVAPVLKESEAKMHENESWYEIEHLERTLADANRFKEYLAKFEKELASEE